MQQIQTRLVDDISGGEAARTVKFSYDGRSYEIDLSEEHAAELEATFAPFVAKARHVGTAPRLRQRNSNPANKEHLGQVRAWARQHSVKVADRGRISKEVLEQFAVAQRSSVTPVEKVKPRAHKTTATQATASKPRAKKVSLSPRRAPVAKAAKSV